MQRSQLCIFLLGLALAGVLFAQEETTGTNATEVIENGSDVDGSGMDDTSERSLLELLGGDDFGNDTFNSTDSFGNETLNSTDSMSNETLNSEDSMGNETLDSMDTFDNETLNSEDSMGNETSSDSAALLGLDEGVNSGEVSKACERNAICYSDENCGAHGKCHGAFVGKCNCHACINYAQCNDDSSCGGLKGACASSRCNCDQGNGFFFSILNFLYIHPTIFQVSSPMVSPTLLMHCLNSATRKNVLVLLAMNVLVSHAIVVDAPVLLKLMKMLLQLS